MMEAMIPAQVGMSLQTLQKKEAKEAHPKKEKERKGAMLLSFFHTCASE